MIAHGKQVYERHCLACHGDKGDGNGPAATFLHEQRPRNFTFGVFKFRLTKGPLPTDADLLRTITRGVRGTAMPAWFELPLQDRLAVIQYVKYELAADRSDPSSPTLLRRRAAGAAARDRHAAAAHGGDGRARRGRSGGRPNAGSATATPARATARRRPG